MSVENEVSLTGQYTFTIWPRAGSVESSEPFRVCKYVCTDGSVNGDFVAAGNGLCEIKNVTVTLYGEWQQKKGRTTFQVSSWSMAEPDTKEGIIEYLCSLKCGIGKKRAEAVYATFGENTWDIIENQPERLKEAGLGIITIRNTCAALKKGQMQAKIMHLFRDTQITYTQVNNLVKVFGEDSLNVLELHPYQACKVDGFNFCIIDAIALKKGVDPTNIERREAAVIEVLDSVSSEGHVCYPRNLLIDKMGRLLNANLGNVVTPEMCDAAITATIADRMTANSAGHIYTIERYYEERRIAHEIFRLIDSANDPFPDEVLNNVIEQYERDTGFTLADSQKEAVKCAMNNPVCILTGGPGTGKTTTTKAILYAHKALFGEASGPDNVSLPVLLSPTGKAARRLAEQTGLEASTIHSALGLGEKSFSGLIEDDEVNTLDGNIILVDEVSMADLYVTCELVRAVPTGAKIVFVGDPDQLPSVGCGNVLYEFIRSEVIPTVALSVIFRQAQDNPIVENSFRVKNGNPCLHYNGSSFSILRTASADKIFERSCSMYLQSVEKYGIDSTVLLCPYRSATALNVNRFNLYLQSKLNPPKANELTMRGKTITVARGENVPIEFRTGDKVMQTKNTDAAKNGDVGYIRSIRLINDPDSPGNTIRVAFVEFNGDGMEVMLNAEEMKSLDLAYCSTVHKSQGSEYKNVLMVMSSLHQQMLKRNLFYTGITRAKENVLIIGEESAVAIAILTNQTEKRYTLLSDRLVHEAKKRKQAA